MSYTGRIFIILSVIIAILSFVWILLYQLLKENVSNILEPSEGYVFDYIVVGGGTAGSVLATLLTKHSNSTVLLLEAGDKFGFISKIPLLATVLQKSVNDWSFLSVPQRYSSKGLHDQRQALPRGKGLGGSSQINFMLHFDGYDKDFDRWKQMGLREWSSKIMKPFIDAAKPKSDEYFKIRRHYSKLAEAFDRAETDFEHKPWNFRRAKYTVRRGYRWGVYQKYLQTVYGKWNLKIITNAVVRRVNIKNGLAESVTVGIKDDDGKETKFDFKASKEIIISSGAYQSPQVLLSSGIGPKNFLQKIGIPVQNDLPKVGKNLFDHMNLPLFVSVAEKTSINADALLSIREVLTYFTTGTGHFGNFGVIGNVDSMEEKSGSMLFGVGAIDESALMSISNFKREHFRALFPLYYNSTQEGFVIISTCLQPKSRGSVVVRNDNVRRNPLIDPNYLAEIEDVNCTIRAIRNSIKIATSDAFAILKPKIHWPKIKECSNFGPFERDSKWNQPSDNYLECILRYVGLTSHHPGGSCRMGLTKYDSVVDQDLRVHGVRGLRVIDASVLPTPLSGNPNSIIIAIAIRGAALIIKSNKDK
ncbi:neither inactivation nor afterpotential protein G [Episyrphus balteatus]|uniref:neither inactivation nor afterpotential protein G n=1 Tax=Episyrphus balteatus TaxID=286459 RepID=UPI002485A1EA|nr:neither inactivation nor afterpotential protein G [Episyrphus balteatus]